MDSTDSVSNVDNSVNPWKLAALGTATVGGIVVGHAVLNEFWWKGEYEDFHFNNGQDYEYALNADKLGHLYFAYATSTIYKDLFEWTGVDSNSAAWYGAGVSMAYQTYIEIRDGFSKDYGFSWGDIAANTIGAGFSVARHYVPALRPIELQISFYPSNAFKDGEYSAIIDDYTSTTHWLTVSVADYLPASVASWYPAWLGFAVGHSVENLDGKGGGNHMLYLSIDWQFHKIKGLAPWAQTLFRLLHLYHLPAPAVKVYPNVVWYGLRF